MGAVREEPLFSDLGYTPKELTARLGVSTKTLSRMRKKGNGPPFIVRQRQYFYPFHEYFAWLAEKHGEIQTIT